MCLTKVLLIKSRSLERDIRDCETPSVHQFFLIHYLTKEFTHDSKNSTGWLLQKQVHTPGIINSASIAKNVPLGTAGELIDRSCRHIQAELRSIKRRERPPRFDQFIERPLLDYFAFPQDQYPVRFSHC